jgi:hypothetical protein
MKKSIFLSLNGYDEDLCTNGKYSPDDREFNKRYNKLIDEPTNVSSSPMYVIINNNSLFHKLKRV